MLGNQFLQGEELPSENNRTTWMLNCQGCHRADGSATADQVPALKNKVSRFLLVEGGREYLAQVPGVALSPLDDKRLAALTNWMLRTFDPQHIPSDFEAYSASELGRLRKQPLGSEAGVVRAALISSHGEVFN